MITKKLVLGVAVVLVLALAGCSRQQSDWQKTRETNTSDAYEAFLKKYPTGEFTPQAQARVKEIYEERDWQKARDADTPEAYQAFLKQYPEGKWTEEARIRVENFTLAQAPSGTGATDGAPAGTAGRNTQGEGASITDATAPALPANKAAAPVATPSPAAKAPPATAANPAPTSASGSYAVQLGAFKAGAGAANKHWSELQKDYPSLFSGLKPHVLSKDTDAGSLHRLQATGLSEKRARSICDALKAKSQACVVVPPA